MQLIDRVSLAVLAVGYVTTCILMWAWACMSFKLLGSAAA